MLFRSSGTQNNILDTLKNAGLTDGSTNPKGTISVLLPDNTTGYFDPKTNIVYNNNGSVNLDATHPVDMTSPDGTKTTDTVAGPGGMRGSSSTQVQYDSAGKPIGITFIDSMGVTKNLPATLDSSGSLTYTENGTTKSVMMDSKGNPITYKSFNDATGKLEDIPVLRDPKTGQPTWKGDVLPIDQYETVWRLQNPEKWQSMANDYYSGVGKETMSINEYIQKRIADEGLKPGATPVTTVDTKTTVKDFLNNINWKGALAGEAGESIAALAELKSIPQVADLVLSAQSSGFINDIKNYYDTANTQQDKLYYQSLMQELVDKKPSLANNETVQSILNDKVFIPELPPVVITGEAIKGSDRVVAIDANGKEVTLGELRSEEHTSELQSH